MVPVVDNHAEATEAVVVVVERVAPAAKTGIKA